MKKSLFFAVLLLLLVPLHAQNFTWTPFFEKVVIFDIFADCKNTYITGSFSGTVQIGDVTLVSQGNSDAFVAKINAQHQVVWAKSIGPMGMSKSGTHIAVNSKDEVVVSGTFSSQPFICKYDSQGNLMVLKVYSNTGASLFISDFAINTDDEIVLVGSYTGSAALENVILLPMGKLDAFAAKLSADLQQVLWTTNNYPIGEFSTAERDFADGLALDAEGNVYVSGAKSQIILLCAGNTGKVFVAKLDGLTGAKIWHIESEGGSGNTTRHFVEVDKEGKYCYFTGSYKYGMLLGGLIFVGNDCDYHLYIGKIDAQTGQALWVSDCSNGDFYPQESALGTDGTIYLGGYYSLYSDTVAQVCGDTLPTTFLQVGFLAGFDPDQGQLTSMTVQTSPTNNGGYVRGVFVSENGAVSVCGSVGANTSFGNQLITSAGQSGGYIAQSAPAQPCGGGPVTFDAGEMQGITDAVIEVPVYVLNFSDVTSFSYTVRVDNLSVATITGQKDFGLAGLTDAEFNILNNGEYLLVSWVTPDGLGKTLPDSTILFKIRIKINGADSVCTPLTILGDPLPVEVTQAPTGFLPAPYLLIDGEVCVKIRGDIRGMILTEDLDPVRDATVTAQSPVASGQFVTDANGIYTITQLPLGHPYDIVPAKNINPTNGVTAFDLSRINQHILQIAPLDSPYKIIAADASNDGKITPVDILILKHLILGMTTDFPNNTSWRFVPKNHVFPDPANPFSSVLPEIIQLPNLTDDFSDGDFIGIKIGDVDLDADGQVRPAPGQPALALAIPTTSARSGEILAIPIRASDFENIVAGQFGMQYDPRLIEFTGLTPGALAIGNESVYAKNGKLGLVWFDPAGNAEGLTFQDGEVLFILRFRVIGAAASSHDVTPGSDHIQSVAFKPGGTPVQINWAAAETSAVLSELPFGAFSSNITAFPNPFSTSVTISFHTGTDSEVAKTLFDSNGRLIFQNRETLTKGTHEWVISETDLPMASGALFYEIEINGEVLRGTLIKI